MYHVDEDDNIHRHELTAAEDDMVATFFKERFQRDANPDRVTKWTEVFHTSVYTVGFPRMT